MINNFKEVKSLYNNETRSTVHTLEHSTSLMRVVYFENPDSEYFCSFCFETAPSDDKGKPHIVEHCTLSGSSLFPYKDPFMKLDSVSVNTYMNALTCPTVTIYPVASKIFEDFKQLFEVYADSVFSPLLSYESFKSEGVSRELKKKKLEIGGVVLSELLSDNFDKDTVSESALQKTLFKGTPYYYNAGGEPSSIVSLTYDEFKAFYQKHYSLDCCTLVLYGKKDILSLLDLIDERYISKQGKSKHSSLKRKPLIRKSVNELPFYKNPKDRVCYYEKDSDNAMASCTIHLLSTLEPGNPYDFWMFTIIEDALLGNAQAPLSKALAESKLGGDVSALTAFNTTTPYYVFSFGLDDFKRLKGESNMALIERARTSLLSVFKKVIDSGIDEAFIKASLKYYTFKLKEGPLSDPLGLYATYRMTSYIIGQTDDPLLNLNGAAYIEQIKKDYECNPNLFVDFVKKNILADSKNSVILTLPKADLRKKAKQKREQIALKAYEKEQSLQNAKPSVFLAVNEKDTAPFEIKTKITPERLASLFEKDEVEEELINGVSYVFNKIDKDGIYYINVAFDVSGCSIKELQALSFLSSYIRHIGAGEYTSEELAKKLLLTSLSFSASIINVSEKRRSDQLKAYFVFRAKLEEADADEFLNLLALLINEMKTDDEKAFFNAVTDEKGTLTSLFTREPYSFFTAEAFSHYSPYYALKSHIKGVNYLKYVLGLTVGDMKEYSTLIKKVFVKNALRVFISGSRYKDVSNFVNSFEERPILLPYINIVTSERNSYFSYPFETLYNAHSYKVEALNGAYDVYSALLDSKKLYALLRTEGGAYGCGSMYLDSGEFAIYSLDDPECEKTYARMRESLSFDFTEKDLEDAKIRSLKSLADRNTTEVKASISFIRYLSKLTTKMRQENIERILNTESCDIKRIREVLLGQQPIFTTLGDEKRFSHLVEGENIVKIL